MVNLRDRMIQFMNGRYGMDQLNNGLMVVAIALLILNTFLGFPVLMGFMWVVTICAMVRMYSRNIDKRTRENEQFMRIWKPVRKKWRLFLKRIREGKTHRFRTCPHCRAVIRMPRRRGVRIITCPTCRTDFKTRILF